MAQDAETDRELQGERSPRSCRAQAGQVSWAVHCSSPSDVKRAGLPPGVMLACVCAASTTSYSAGGVGVLPPPTNIAVADAQADKPKAQPQAQHPRVRRVLEANPELAAEVHAHPGLEGRVEELVGRACVAAEQPACCTCLKCVSARALPCVPCKLPGTDGWRLDLAVQLKPHTSSSRGSKPRKKDAEHEVRFAGGSWPRGRVAGTAWVALRCRRALGAQ